MKVIIIGAGAAGLAAGQYLNKRNINVTILEARPRIGGRIWTDYNWVNFPIELGASVIHGDKAITFNYVPKSETISVGDIPVWFFKVGKKWRRGKEIIDSFNHVDQELINFTGPDKDIASWLEGIIKEPEIRKVIAFELTNPYLANPTEMSVAELAHEWRVNHSGEGHFLIKTGYNSVVKKLATGLEVLVGQIVSSISWTEKGVEVKIDNGRTIRGDKVIVTVPLSILQRGIIKFNPSLPLEKLKAIKFLKMGEVAKLFIRFKESFWAKDNPAYISSGEFPFIFPSSEGRGNNPVLTFFITRNDDSVLDFSDSEILEWALEKTGDLFGRRTKDLFIDYRLADWQKEDWIWAGYSFVPVGTAWAREELAKSLDSVLFFAGEATVTDSNPSTVHGAIESGIRAAKEILDLGY